MIIISGSSVFFSTTAIAAVLTALEGFADNKHKTENKAENKSATRKKEECCIVEKSSCTRPLTVISAVA